MTRIRGEAADSDLIQSADYKDPFEVITEDDKDAASQEMAKEIAQYAGYTFMVVIFLLVLVACFASDPRTFVIAFGTGSPCCLLCPCITGLYKYMNPGKLVQDSVNQYVPGLIVEDDMTISYYDPSPAEIDSLLELVDIVTTL